MKLKQSLSMASIKFARKLFYNTPVQRWRFTSLVYDTVFHAGYTEKELKTNYFGADLVFPGRDFTITPGLIGGFYERYELELFQKICMISENIVDVGGNIGLYSVVAGRAVAVKGGSVEVFEPVPENYKFLKKNIVNNNLGEVVKPFKKAVSSQAGTAQIFLSKKNIGTHSLASKAADSVDSIEVDVIKLDDFLNPKRRVDVLKVDVEGYDGYVLEGALKLLKKQKPTLFIELVPRHLLAAEYNPMHFVDNIFTSYTHVYLIDEVKEKVELVSKKDLLVYVNLGKNVNIIAVHNRDHLGILQDYVAR